MVKPWPTQRIALLCGAPLGFFFELFFGPTADWDWDASSIGDVVMDWMGGAVVGVLLVAAICGGRNLLLRAK
jgi:hypothetical protein